MAKFNLNGKLMSLMSYNYRVTKSMTPGVEIMLWN